VRRSRIPVLTLAAAASAALVSPLAGAARGVRRSMGARPVSPYDSPQFHDGVFHNRLPMSVVEPGSTGSMAAEWARRGDVGRPKQAVPLVTPELPRRASDLAATWLGHATVLLEVGGHWVLTDPVWSERASPFQWIGPRRFTPPALRAHQLPPIDVLLLSHNHYDHLDKSSVKRIARANPGVKWVAPLRLSQYTRRWGIRDFVELDWWGSAVVDGIRVTATPARHFAARGLGDRNKSLWCGFALEGGGRRVYFAGDTAYHPASTEIGERCGPFDFVMIPIGAYDPRWFMKIVHVDPEEAVQIYRDIIAAHPNARNPLMLAIHWGTFRFTDEPMDEPPRRTITRWRDVGLSADRLWVARFGETRSID